MNGERGESKHLLFYVQARFQWQVSNYRLSTHGLADVRISAHPTGALPHCPCPPGRDGARQLAMLDQVAGTARLAGALAATLRTLGEARAQLAALAELGDEEEREAMQAMVDQVGLKLEAKD